MTAALKPDLDALIERLRTDGSFAGMVEREEQAAAALSALREELERERMRLAACGVVALANTPESAASAREMHPDYRSDSCDEVAKAVDREMALRAERDAAREALQKIADEPHTNQPWLTLATIQSFARAALAAKEPKT